MSDRSKESQVRKDHAAAADWLARRDRGLSAAEQDEYLQWLRDDSRRAALISRHETTARRLRGLARWQPSTSSEPNPDLFARPRRSRPLFALFGAVAAAAALVIGTMAWRPSPTFSPTLAAASPTLRINERQKLADGSEVELKDGSRIEVEFSSGLRQVRLNGEAHFKVAKDANRPFVVHAGGVAVRAVGTAFNVRLAAGTVDVLVTEGKVSVAPVSVEPLVAEEKPAPRMVEAKQRVVVSLDHPAIVPVAVEVTPEQIRETLAWQAPRFEFDGTPLAEAVAEFNRLNSTRRLILEDAELGRQPISGTFRVDNVEGFVRLLEVTFGVQGMPRGSGETLLKRGSL